MEQAHGRGGGWGRRGTGAAALDGQPAKMQLAIGPNTKGFVIEHGCERLYQTKVTTLITVTAHHSVSGEQNRLLHHWRMLKEA
jgi:hypothetical protein